MIRLLALFAAILLILGVASIYNVDTQYGSYYFISAFLVYLLYRALTSRELMSFMAPVLNWNTYKSPGDIIEAAEVLEQHKSGREMDTGGDVHITQAVWECDYSVHLNARTLLDSTDPKINVIDERTDPEVDLIWHT